MSHHQQPVDIVLSAYECDASRLLRLGRVVVYVFSCATNWSVADVLLLTRLHDHKGQLQARYSATPSDALRKLVEHAWAEQHEYDAQHEVGSPEVWR